MTSKAIATLERAAIEAHRHGQTWEEFWRNHAAKVREAEPRDRARFHDLVKRLLHLVCAGEPAGRSNVGAPSAPMPWERDDQLARLPEHRLVTPATIYAGSATEDGLELR